MKTRIISAIVMCAIVIPIILIGGLPFKILGVVLAIASMYEIIKAREGNSKIPLSIRLISYVLIASFVYLGTDVYSVRYEFIYKILIVLWDFFKIIFFFLNWNKKFCFF